MAQTFTAQITFPSAIPGTGASRSIAENNAVAISTSPNNGGIDALTETFASVPAGTDSLTCIFGLTGTATFGTDYVLIDGYSDTVITNTTPIYDDSARTFTIDDCGNDPVETPLTSRLRITDDTNDEPDETVILTLQRVEAFDSSSASLGLATIIAPAILTLTINDNDPATVPQPFTAQITFPSAIPGTGASRSIAENNAVAISTAPNNGGIDVITDTFTNVPAGTDFLTCIFGLTGTATFGTDYVLINGYDDTVITTTTPGYDGSARTYTVDDCGGVPVEIPITSRLRITDDTNNEPDETVILTLQRVEAFDSSSASLGLATITAPAILTLTINDNDPFTAQITFPSAIPGTGASRSIVENNAVAISTAPNNGGIDALTETFTSVPAGTDSLTCIFGLTGTATFGTDYVFIDGSDNTVITTTTPGYDGSARTFTEDDCGGDPVGTPLTSRLRITDDTHNEPDETVILTLQRVEAFDSSSDSLGLATITAPAILTLTINDNDPFTAQITFASAIPGTGASRSIVENNAVAISTAPNNGGIDALTETFTSVPAGTDSLTCIFGLTGTATFGTDYVFIDGDDDTVITTTTPGYDGSARTFTTDDCGGSPVGTPLTSRLRITDDTNNEPDETVILTLQRVEAFDSSSNLLGIATITAPAILTLTINDNDPFTAQITFASAIPGTGASRSIVENNAVAISTAPNNGGIDALTETFTSVPAGTDSLTCIFGLTGTATFGTDYVFIDGSDNTVITTTTPGYDGSARTFTEDDCGGDPVGTPLTSRLRITDDTHNEPDETVILTLQRVEAFDSSSDSLGIATITAPAILTLTINDNDPFTAQITFASAIPGTGASRSIVENNAVAISTAPNNGGIDAITETYTNVPAGTDSLTCIFGLTGTATFGTDYVFIDGSDNTVITTTTPGYDGSARIFTTDDCGGDPIETPLTSRLRITDDTHNEPDETVILTLQRVEAFDSSSVSLGIATITAPAILTLTINDNDPFTAQITFPSAIPGTGASRSIVENNAVAISTAPNNGGIDALTETFTSVPAGTDSLTCIFGLTGTATFGTDYVFIDGDDDTVITTTTPGYDGSARTFTTDDCGGSPVGTPLTSRLRITDDTNNEPDETVILTLQRVEAFDSSSNLLGIATITAPAILTLTINDNDPFTAQITFASAIPGTGASRSIVENNAVAISTAPNNGGIDALTETFTSVPAGTDSLTCIFGLTGTATFGTDYVFIDGSDNTVITNTTPGYDGSARTFTEDDCGGDPVGTPLTSRLRITDDTNNEPDETVILTLQRVEAFDFSSVSLGIATITAPAILTLTINDNDPFTAQITFPSAIPGTGASRSIAENNAVAISTAPNNGGIDVITDTFTNVPAGTDFLTCIFGLTGTATFGTDYVLINGYDDTVITTTTPGYDGSARTYTVDDCGGVPVEIPITSRLRITDDTNDEPDETVIFTLQSVEAFDSSRVSLGLATIIAPAILTLTINDNDPATVPQPFTAQITFASAIPGTGAFRSIAENNAVAISTAPNNGGINAITETFTNVPPTIYSLTCTFRLTGTATFGTDYVFIDGDDDTVITNTTPGYDGSARTFTEDDCGGSPVDIPLTSRLRITDDTNDEPDETIILTLRRVEAFDLSRDSLGLATITAPAILTLTINDNDLATEPFTAQITFPSAIPGTGASRSIAENNAVAISTAPNNGGIDVITETFTNVPAGTDSLTCIFGLTGTATFGTDYVFIDGDDDTVITNTTPGYDGSARTFTTDECGGSPVGTSLTSRLRITDDTNNEPDETIILTLQSVEAFDSSIVSLGIATIIAPAILTLTINDNDPVTLPQPFTAQITFPSAIPGTGASRSIAENNTVAISTSPNNGGIDALTETFTNVPAGTDSLTCIFGLTGTATFGTDYVFIDGDDDTVITNTTPGYDGSARTYIEDDCGGSPVGAPLTSRLRITDDTNDEPDETVILTLQRVEAFDSSIVSLGIATIIAPAILTLTINDDDEDSAGICGRTQQVQDQILGSIFAEQGFFNREDCDEVTPAELASVSVLFLGRERFLGEVQPGDFQGLSGLLLLGLSRNGFTTLPDGIFSELVSLKHLGLSNNELTTLPDDIFSGLGNLRYLGLWNNELTTLPDGIFSDLTLLKYLALESNRLTSLSGGAFTGLISLKDLVLNGNGLSSLSADVFTGLVNLQDLLLHDNALTNLPAGVFTDLDNLRRLDLSGNPGLTSLEAGVFDDILDTLRSLYLDDVLKGTLSFSAPAAGLAPGATVMVSVQLDRALPARVRVPYSVSFAGGAAGDFDGLADGALDFNAGETSRAVRVTASEAATPGAVANLTLGVPMLLDVDGNANTHFNVNNALVEVHRVLNRHTLIVSDASAPSEVIEFTADDAGNAVDGTAIDLLLILNRPALVGTTVTIPYTIAATGGVVAGDIEDADADGDGNSLTGRIIVNPGSNAGRFTIAAAADFRPDGMKTFTVSLGPLPAGLSLAGGEDGVAAYTVSDICGRTQQVRDAIVQAAAGAAACGDVTPAHLAGITSLDLGSSSTRLRTLQAGDFAGLTNLVDLSLNDNGLTSLPNDVFSGLTGLQELNLANNQLTEIPADVFNGLTNLRELRLINNILTDLPAGVFTGLTSLEDLRLQNNDSLPAGVFSGLTGLEYLHLTNFGLTSLTSLPADVFSGLTGLEVLLLNGNDPAIFPIDAFADLTSLEEFWWRLNSGFPDGLFDDVLDTLVQLMVADEIRGALSFDQSAAELGQNAPVEVDVTLSRALPAAVRVSYALSFGGGADESHFSDDAGGMLTFTAGQTRTSVTVRAMANAPVDGTAKLMLGAPVLLDGDGEASPLHASALVVEGSTQTHTITVVPVTVVDVNPAHGMGTGVVGSVAENESSNITVGITVEARRDGNTLAGTQFALVGSSDFQIDANSGVVTTTGPLDYEALSSPYQITITVMATPLGETLIQRQFVIAVTNVNEAPTVEITSDADVADDAFLATTDEAIQLGSVVMDQDVGDGHRYNWVATPPAGVTLSPSNGITTAFTAIQAGDYLVRLTVTDNGGLSAFTMVTVRVEDSAGICGRTQQVQDRILSSSSFFRDEDGYFNREDCDEVTAAELASVSILFLRNGVLSGEDLQPGDFQGLSGLLQLALSRNGFTTLPDGIFSELVSLKHLGLSNNELTSLPDGIFSGLGNLRYLGLWNNELTTLPDGIFSDLTLLKYLALESNRLTSLSGGAFTGLTNLKELVLNGNGLSSLSADVFTGLVSLQDLLLHDNALMNLPAGVFTGLDSLRRLNLSGNPSLTNLEVGVFDDVLDTLRSLYLDDVLKGTVSFSALAAGLAPGATVMVSVQLDRALPARVRVPYSVSFAGGAAGDFDGLADGALDFNAGETNRAVRVTALEAATPGAVANLTLGIPMLLDADGNANTHFNVNNALVEVHRVLNRHTLIVSGPGSPAPSEITAFTAVDASSVADGTAIDLILTLNHPALAGAAVTIAYTIAATGGVGAGDIEDADADGDGNPLTGQIVVNPGSNAGRFTITAAADFRPNGMKTFTVSLGPLPAGLSLADGEDGMAAYTVSGICGRTQQVHDAIVQAVAAAAACGDVTPAHLAGITSLDLDSTRLQTLQAGDFAGLTNLVELSLNGNSLTSLTDDVFSGLTGLQELNLEGSQLTELPAGIFNGLTNLRELRLRNNSLTDLPVGVFTGLTSLEDLRLRGNSTLASLPAGVFSGLAGLEYLDLTNSGLTSLPADVFSGLTGLETLLLSGNDPAIFPIDAFADLTSLKGFWWALDSGFPDGLFDDVLDTLVQLIVANEIRSALSFDQSAAELGQNAPVEVDVTLSRALPAAVRVSYALSFGEGADASHFSDDAAGMLTFSAGQTRTSVTVRTTGNVPVDGTARLTLGAPVLLDGAGEASPLHASALVVEGSTQTHTITVIPQSAVPVTVVDVNSAHGMGTGVVGSVAENESSNSTVGITVEARRGNDVLTVMQFVLTGSNDFQIDANGVVTTTGMLDREVAILHTITVTATLSEGGTAQEQFIIAVTNVNEAPAVTIVPGLGVRVDPESGVFLVMTDETVELGSAVADPDVGDTHDYNWTSSAGVTFGRPNGSTTTFTVSRAGDYPVGLTATDNDGLSASTMVTVRVESDVTAVLSPVGAGTLSVSAGGTAMLTVTTDPVLRDGETATLILSVSGGADVSLNPAQVTLSDATTQAQVAVVAGLQAAQLAEDVAVMVAVTAAADASGVNVNLGAGLPLEVVPLSVEVTFTETGIELIAGEERTIGFEVSPADRGTPQISVAFEENDASDGITVTSSVTVAEGATTGNVTVAVGEDVLPGLSAQVTVDAQGTNAGRAQVSGTNSLRVTVVRNVDVVLDPAGLLSVPTGRSTMLTVTTDPALRAGESAMLTLSVGDAVGVSLSSTQVVLRGADATSVQVELIAELGAAVGTTGKVSVTVAANSGVRVNAEVNPPFSVAQLQLEVSFSREQVNLAMAPRRVEVEVQPTLVHGAEKITVGLDVEREPGSTGTIIVSPSTVVLSAAQSATEVAITMTDVEVGESATITLTIDDVGTDVGGAQTSVAGDLRMNVVSRDVRAVFLDDASLAGINALTLAADGSTMVRVSTTPTLNMGETAILDLEVLGDNGLSVVPASVMLNSSTANEQVMLSAARLAGGTVNVSALERLAAEVAVLRGRLEVTVVPMVFTVTLAGAGGDLVSGRSTTARLSVSPALEDGETITVNFDAEGEIMAVDPVTLDAARRPSATITVTAADNVEADGAFMVTPQIDSDRSNIGNANVTAAGSLQGTVRRLFIVSFSQETLMLTHRQASSPVDVGTGEPPLLTSGEEITVTLTSSGSVTVLPSTVTLTQGVLQSTTVTIRVPPDLESEGNVGSVTLSAASTGGVFVESDDQPLQVFFEPNRGIMLRIRAFLEGALQ